jgi:hypothetical protein
MPGPLRGGRRPRHRRAPALVMAVVLATAGLAVGVGRSALADTSPFPNPPLPTCLPEQYPHAGSPRSSAYVPYEIPFSSTIGPGPGNPNIGGGYLEINSPNSAFTVTLGGPLSAGPVPTGSITAKVCGLFELPNQTGGISGNPYGAGQTPRYNNNFIFNNPISVSIGLKGIAVPLLDSFGAAAGFASAAIERTPAANGGLNVDFYASAKSTAVLNPCSLAAITNLLGGSPLTQPKSCTGLSISLPGGECTVNIGNLLDDGTPPADIANLGITRAQALTIVHASTRFSTPAGSTHPGISGQPVTGPITAARAVLVANDFPIAKIDPNTPPAPDAPNAGAPPSTLCSATNASLFNTLLGLPSPAGYNTFYAPSTFAVHTSS